MASVSTNLSNHFAEMITTLSSCVKITRRDGTVLGFTDHDAPITYDGVTYQPVLDLPTNFRNEMNNKASNVSLNGFFVSGGLTREDFLAHLYDGARIILFVINWADTSMGIRILPGSGWFGKTKVEDFQYIAEFMSLGAQLQTQEGKVISRLCQYDFGDSNCGADLSLFTENGTVESITNRTQFTASISASQTLPDGVTDNRTQNHWYTDGLIVWFSGDNADYSRQVLVQTMESSGDYDIQLSLPMENVISVGDTFYITAGCPKSKSGCKIRGRWTQDNVYHGGFPYVPGMDKMNQQGEMLKKD